MKIIHTAGLTIAVMMGVVGFSSTASAAGDAAAGGGKIAVCVACHGKDGMATADIYPNLAGQSADYLESSMKAYRENQRKGGMSAVMTPQATNLSDEDIADIAAYYSQQ
ncbi:MAG: c-type cytochrome [Halomonas sp.]|uniref:c-type cytochrome n=1 Tax=Halomonas sp. TaxID=1486246 RepID=UPI003F9079AA